MTGPLVSVLMPAYNTRSTLPWALGSLLAQTYEEWELVFVDDGSTDHPEEIVEQAGDPRIRHVRLAENRGRGHARQVALDQARGEFIAMLDADDWMYPTRLQRQVEALLANPAVSLVSAGMAIVDPDNDLVGIRDGGSGAVHEPFHGISSPVPHAPSMFRQEGVGSARYDPALRYGEDQDFLVRLLQGKRFVSLPTVEYVYAELASVTARKAAKTHRYVRRGYRKHFATHPAQVVVASGASLAKEIVYRAGAALGLDQSLVRRRSRSPDAGERQCFDDARATIGATVSSRFPGPALDPARREIQ